LPANRLKTTYQRNFLIGTCSAVFLTAITCGFLFWNMEPTRMLIIDSGDVVLTDYPPLNYGQGLGDRDPEGSGGLKHGLSVIPESPESFSGEAVPLLDTPDRALLSFATLIGKGDILIVPDGSSDLPDFSRFRPGDDAYTRAVSDNYRGPLKGIGWASRAGGYPDPGTLNFPLWISGLDIKHPFNPLGLVDTVIVLMTIDGTGKILSIETIYDGYPELGFAAEFKRALYASRITPSRVHGRPVGGTYPIWCIFERSGMQQIIKNSPDILISSSQ